MNAFIYFRAQIEDEVTNALYMAPRFRRRSKDEESPNDSEDDSDLDEVVEEENPEEFSEENLEDSIVEDEIDIDTILLDSAKMVTHTCMDIRRGENVLIVCDPTTGKIGQALHEMATKRSDRVLLIVMPKSRHHGEEPPSPVANLMRQ